MVSGLYALVPEEKIKEVLDTLHTFSGLQIRLIDKDGGLLQSNGSGSNYCAVLKKKIFTEDACDMLHLKASRQAQELGEAYIFTCHADLNHIAFPLSHHSKLLGSVILGPFLMDFPDMTFIDTLNEKYPVPQENEEDLYKKLLELPVINPVHVRQIKRLTEQLLSSLLVSERVLLLQMQEKMSQQVRINETIQLFKEQGMPTERSLFYEKEDELLNKVRTGDLRGTKKLLNELVAHVLVAEGAGVDAVRMCAVELTTLVSRAASRSSTRADSIYHLSSRYISMMLREKKVDELCYLLQEAVESFMDSMFGDKDKGNPHIRQALCYMAENYNRPLTLNDVAKEAGLSPSYFSALFKKVVGRGFSEHLCRIRVEESKRLLLSSDFSLAEIAIAMGFNDQSYYCKVFRRIVGLPPGQYRNR